MIWRKIWRYRAGLVGLFIVVAMTGIALGAALVSPHDPYDQDVTARLKPPVWMAGGSATHLLGTDPLGETSLPGSSTDRRSPWPPAPSLS